MATLTDPHLSLVRPVTPQTPGGCEECLILGSEWVHLRLCLTCGHVGCCDSSPHRQFDVMPQDAPVVIVHGLLLRNPHPRRLGQTSGHRRRRGRDGDPACFERTRPT